MLFVVSGEFLSDAIEDKGLVANNDKLVFKIAGLLLGGGTE